MPVPAGEEARPRSRSTVTGGVAHVAVGKMAVAVSVMPVAVSVMPVAVAVDAAGVAVMPVGARMDPVRMQVQAMGMPVVSVSVPRAVRPGRRRGMGMSMGNGEERHERAEREPRDRIAAPVPVMVPPARLRTTGKDKRGCENETRQPRRTSPPTSSSGHVPANVCSAHHAPSRSAVSHFELPRRGVKRETAGRSRDQPPVRAARHQPSSAPGKRPTTRTLSAFTLMTSRRGFATTRAGSPGSSKYMSLTMRR